MLLPFPIEKMLVLLLASGLAVAFIYLKISRPDRHFRVPRRYQNEAQAITNVLRQHQEPLSFEQLQAELHLPSDQLLQALKHSVNASDVRMTPGGNGEMLFEAPDHIRRVGQPG